MNFFTTDAFPSRARVLSWQDHVNHLYPATDLLGVSREEFSGRVAWRDIGAARISRIDHERLLQLNFQLEGEGWVGQDGRGAVTRPGQFVVYDSARPYEMHFGGPFRQLSLELPRAAVVSEFDDLSRLMARPIDGRSGSGRFLFDFVRTLADDEDPADRPLASRLQHHVIELLVTALVGVSVPTGSHTGGRRRSLDRVKRYLRERLDDPDLTPASIAAAHHMSLRYLHTLFRAQSESPVRWIQAERLDRCYADLSDPAQQHRSICDIAHRWGFRDAAHFSRAFRRRFGHTPRECRPAGATSDPTQ